MKVYENLCIECKSIEVKDFEPQFCCSGSIESGCGCLGEPINYYECVCNNCLEALPQYSKVTNKQEINIILGRKNHEARNKVKA